MTMSMLKRAWFAFALVFVFVGAEAREAPRDARPDGAAIASAHALATDAGQKMTAAVARRRTDFTRSIMIISLPSTGV